MISAENVRWIVAGLLLPAVVVNIGLINVILNDKLRYPLRVVLAFNLLYALVGGGAVYWVTASAIATLLVVLEIGASFTVIFFVLKERDRKAIKLAERFIEFERVVDLHLSFILAAIREHKPRSQIQKNIQQALDYILDLLGDFLALNDKQLRKDDLDHRMCIFLSNKKGKFDVLAFTGLTITQLQKIKTEFAYEPKPVSIAGYAAANNAYICIPDLAADTSADSPAKYWVQSETGEAREGFLLCYPITRGVGQEAQRSLAVISLSSHVRKAYDCASAKQLIDRIAPKLENLVYLRELVG